MRKPRQETGDALSMLLTKGSTSFGGNKDLQFAIKSLEIGSALSIPELLGIAGLLQNTARIKSYGRKAREEDADTSLTPYFATLEPLTRVSEEISRCILSEEEIADDAQSEAEIHPPFHCLNRRQNSLPAEQHGERLLPNLPAGQRYYDA